METGENPRLDGDAGREGVPMPFSARRVASLDVATLDPEKAVPHLM